MWAHLPKPFFILAPMEAVTDVVFRHVIKQASPPDVFFTEFTNATGWVHAGEKAIGSRLIRTEDEDPIVAQIWGGEPGDMEQLAAHCKELGFHGIDINMGCPAKSAIKSGGSALIRKPELAAAAIAAAKTAGLPVSVKTRLGYTHIDEWKDWLSHLLRQEIVNLTIHLRTKKEMSKVPAHHELIPDILALRDEIAPGTLITINGDIENRAEGLALTKKHPGIDGIMIGRGIFHNPFAFSPTEFSETASSRAFVEHASAKTRSADVSENSSASGSPDAAPAVTDSESLLHGGKSVVQPESPDEIGETQRVTPSAKDGSGAMTVSSTEKANKMKLINLLHLHLDLFDQWDTPEHPRKFDPLKRFFKIYVNSFEGAAELRDKLMHTKNTAEVRAVLKDWSL